MSALCISMMLCTDSSLNYSLTCLVETCLFMSASSPGCCIPLLYHWCLCGLVAAYVHASSCVYSLDPCLVVAEQFILPLTCLVLVVVFTVAVGAAGFVVHYCLSASLPCIFVHRCSW